jgi:RNA polymerase sigma-70 factor, ECF subfamily
MEGSFMGYIDRSEAIDFLHIRSKENNFELIMEMYSTDIFRVAYSYVKNKEQADDITQAVFIKCFIQFEQFRGQNLKSWLIKITVNCCKDYFRSWHYKQTLISDSLTSMFKDRTNTEETVIRRDENQQISDALLSLPIRYREVLFLHYFEELSLLEISNLLGFNLNTIKTRHKRAKELLKKKIIEWGV